MGDITAGANRCYRSNADMPDGHSAVCTSPKMARTGSSIPSKKPVELRVLASPSETTLCSNHCPGNSCVLRLLLTHSFLCTPSAGEEVQHLKVGTKGDSASSGAVAAPLEISTHHSMQAEAPSPLQLYTPPGAGPLKESRLQPRGAVDLHAAAPSDSSVAVRRQESTCPT